MGGNDFYTSVDWNIESLVARGPRFHRVSRVPISSDGLEACLQGHEDQGIPLVVENLHHHPNWKHDMFNLDWFVEHGQKNITVRHVNTRRDHTIPVEDFVSHSRNAVKTQETRRSGGPDVFYAKDAVCPDAWQQWLDNSGVVPASLRPYEPEDLFQYLPRFARVETLMCYLGVGGTFTPCHKDLCASSGQNIMMYTENSASAFWFMTKGSDAPSVARYFQGLRQELERESYTITVDELALAPFDVYITEQKLGDLVLVPPRSCHQVVNYGGMSVKMSWSRMTLDGAATALRHELPVYHRMCRKEVYRIKSTIHYAVLAITRTLETQPDANNDLCLSTNLACGPATDLRFLTELLREILINEYHSSQATFSTIVKALSNEDHPTFTCDCCEADIFLSFFECRRCASSSTEAIPLGEGLHLCAACYAEGRTCACQIMEPVQIWPYKDVVEDYNRALRALAIKGVVELDALDACEDPCPLEDDEVGLFKAGVSVRNWLSSRGARRQKDTATCHYGTTRDYRHLVDRGHCFTCKGCHSGKCFAHLAVEGIHSSQIVGEIERDRTHEVWHHRHRMLKKKYEAVKERILDAERSGGGFEIQWAGHRLALAAAVFRVYEPSTKPSRLRPGWYDSVATSLPMDNSPTKDASPGWDRSDDDTDPTHPGSLSSLTSDSEFQPDSPPPAADITVSAVNTRANARAKASHSDVAVPVETPVKHRRSSRMQFDGVVVPEKKAKHASKSSDNPPHNPSRRSTADQHRENARDDKADRPNASGPEPKPIIDVPAAASTTYEGLAKEILDLKMHTTRLDKNMHREISALAKGIEALNKEVSKDTGVTKKDVDALSKDMMFVCDTIQDINERLRGQDEMFQLILESLRPSSTTEDTVPRTLLTQDEKQSTYGDGPDGARQSSAVPAGNGARDPRWEYNAEYASNGEPGQSQSLKRRLTERLGPEGEAFEQQPQGPSQSTQQHYQNGQYRQRPFFNNGNSNYNTRGRGNFTRGRGRGRPAYPQGYHNYSYPHSYPSNDYYYQEHPNGGVGVASVGQNYAGPSAHAYSKMPVPPEHPPYAEYAQTPLRPNHEHYADVGAHPDDHREMYPRFAMDVDPAYNAGQWSERPPPYHMKRRKTVPMAPGAP